MGRVHFLHYDTILIYVLVAAHSLVIRLHGEFDAAWDSSASNALPSNFDRVSNHYCCLVIKVVNTTLSDLNADILRLTSH